VKHAVLMPSFNTGPVLLQHSVRAVCAAWPDVWVVLDGSTDGSADALAALPPPVGLRILSLPRNGGKGAAILHGLRALAAEGFTHALTIDADGQHPAEMIADFIAASRAQPGAMILGVPQFGPDAPALRVGGRRISNAWVGLETLWAGIGDSLFGLRVYPVAPLLRIMQRQRWMRRYDFDAEAAVRLCWAGIPAVNLAAPVRYLTAEQGGVTHFQYGRDNALLTWMHIRLVLGFLARLPLLLRARSVRQRARPP
jgi:glycosyltransferase involved in cell wall biosynthesis